MWNQQTHMIRVIDALSGSSSAAGFFSILNRIKNYNIFKYLPLPFWKIIRNLTAHANLNSNNIKDAFTNCESLLANLDPSLEYLDEVVNKRPALIGDGALVDGTGIKHLIARSDTINRITAIIDTDIEKQKQFMQLFQTPDELTSGFSPVPLFKETSKDAHSFLKSLTKLLPKKENKKKSSKLQQILYGSFKVHTIESKEWGVEGGREILLRVIIVNSDINMGAINWEEYGKILGDIIYTIRHDQNAHDTIKSWF